MQQSWPFQFLISPYQSVDMLFQNVTGLSLKVQRMPVHSSDMQLVMIFNVQTTLLVWLAPEMHVTPHMQ